VQRRDNQHQTYLGDFFRLADTCFGGVFSAFLRMLANRFSAPASTTTSFFNDLLDFTVMSDPRPAGRCDSIANHISDGMRGETRIPSWEPVG